MKTTVYDPQEDSFLLKRYAEKYSSGIVLDMGCGSGILGISALRNDAVREVYFVDINPAALDEARKNYEKEPASHQRKAHFIASDLFSNLVDKKFDTMLFNPPYLPADENDDESLITTGGTQGHELISRFLAMAKYHLNYGARIILLFSSLTGKAAVDNALKRNNYSKRQLASAGFFMERLYVYSIRYDGKIICILKGHRGIVYVTRIGKKKVATKTARTGFYDPIKEAQFLKMLNKHGIGPALISYDDRQMTMEYIEGERIVEYLKKKDLTKDDVKKIMRRILIQLETMDRLGINKLELTNPYKHILIKDKKPVMIDFERCHQTSKPKNITQFIQFISSGKMSQIFSQKDITIDKGRLMSIAKAHKRSSGKTGGIVDGILSCMS